MTGSNERPGARSNQRPSRPVTKITGGPLGEVMARLGRRIRLPGLVARHSSSRVVGLFAFVNGVISIGAMSVAALLTGTPLIFPSLGPTAFLLFSAPLVPAASPRNAVWGHAIGAASGLFALAVFGLADAPPALATSITASRVGATALSLGLTSGLMVWARVPHPPAGATTLIVSLGILTDPVDLVVLMVAVVLLVGQGFVINRLAGIDYPTWRPHPTEPAAPVGPGVGSGPGIGESPPD